MASLFIVYLTGCIINYLMIRKFIKSRFGEWTRSARGLAFSMSCFSWLSVMSVLFIWMIDCANDDDTRTPK